MSEKPSSSRSKPVKIDLKRLQAQHDAMQFRINQLRDSLGQKDMLIKSQRNTIRLYQSKISKLQANHLTLTHINSILTSYILQQLNQTLPPLPSLPQTEDPLYIDPPPAVKSQSRKQNKSKHIHSLGGPAALSSYQNAQKQAQNLAVSRPIVFDQDLSQNMFKDFSGSIFLKSILDSQLQRQQMQKITKFLLGKGSQNAFVFKTRTILFESLSFFLSLRNVAFQNCVEDFLPRVLEMIVDILELEKVSLFLYDENEDFFYSKAVTAELPQQVVLNRDFGHISHSYQKQLIINTPYQDDRFDARYDQMTNFITRNLACTPLVLGDKLIGILECSNKRGSFTAEDMALLSQIARQLSVGIAGDGLKEKMQEISSRNQPKNPKIQSAKQALVLPLLHTIVEAMKNQVNCERVTVYTYEQNSKQLVSLIATDLNGIIRVPLRSSLASLAFTTGKVVNVQNAQTHGLFHSQVDHISGFQTKQVLAVPIQQRGVLQCLNKNNMIAFSKVDQERAFAMASVIASLFESMANLQGVLIGADFNQLCLDAVKEAIFFVNSEGFILKVNRFAAEVFKSSSDQLAGSSLAEVFEESQDVLSNLLGAIEAQKTSEFKKQQVMIGSGGQKKVLEVDVSCVLTKGLGEGTSFVVLMQPTK